jgi:hypothetical protein
MASIRKTKYGSTASHKKICNGLNATNIIIYSYKYFFKVLFPCENQGVTDMEIPESWLLPGPPKGRG